MPRLNRSGSKEFYQAIVFLLLFSSTILNNAIESIIADSLPIELVIKYTIALSIFILIIAPILFLPGKKYTMFALLYVMSLVSIILTEIGSFTILLASYTTIYGLKNDVLPKNIIFKFALAMGLFNALGISIYHSANSEITGFVSGISLYIAGVFIFGYEFGFTSSRISKQLYSLTDQEIDYLIYLKTEPTQIQMADYLGVSLSRMQKVYGDLKKKTGTKSNTGLALWAKDNGLI